MKVLEFGFNDDENLNATWGGIEFYSGEYLDLVNCNNMNFLITRVIESNNGLDGMIDVREVSQDYYNDGSYQTYANRSKEGLCKKLEEYLNKEKIKEKLEKDRPLEILKDAGFPAFTSHLPKVYSDDEKYAEIVTFVRPDVFKKLVDSKKSSLSIFQLYEENRRLLDEIEELKGKSSNRHH